MIEFDNNGYVKPYTIIEINIDDLKNYFAHNSVRKVIFESYLNFIIDLQQIVDSPFEQWIDGSFTTKKQLPFDIDVVNFVEYQTFFKKRDMLNRLKNNYPKIDTYFSEVYPDNHKNATLNIMNKWQWQDVYDTDRLGRKKGILKINF
jgi:hypothetical protein